MVNTEFATLIETIQRILKSKPLPRVPRKNQNEDNAMKTHEDTASQICDSLIDARISENLSPEVVKQFKNNMASNLSMFPWSGDISAKNINFEEFISVLLAAMKVLSIFIPNQVSLGQITILREALQLCIGLGIHSCIAPKSSSCKNEECVSEEKIQFVWFNLEDVQKRELMHRTTHCLLSLRSQSQIKEIIDSQFLDSMLLVLLNETKSPRSDDKSPMQIISEIFDTAESDVAISSLLRLQSGKPPLRTPRWIKVKAGELLSDYLVEKDGLISIIRAMEKLGGEEVFCNNWNAAIALATIVSHCPASKSSNVNEYFSSMCDQVKSILFESPEWSRRYSLVIHAIVRELYAVQPEITESRIFDHLFKPIESCSREMEHSDQVNLTSSLEALWTLCSRNPPQEIFVMMDRLNSCVELFYSASCFALNSISANRQCILNIFHFILETNPETVAGGILANWEKHQWMTVIRFSPTSLSFIIDETGLFAVRDDSNSTASNQRGTAFLLFVDSLEEESRKSLIHPLFCGALRHLCTLSGYSEKGGDRNLDDSSYSSALKDSEKETNFSNAISNLLLFTEQILEKYQDDLMEVPTKLLPLLKDIMSLIDSGMVPEAKGSLESLIMGIASAAMLSGTIKDEDVTLLSDLKPILGEWTRKTDTSEVQDSAKTLFMLLQEIPGEIPEKTSDSEFRKAMSAIKAGSIPEQAGGLTAITRQLKGGSKEVLASSDEIQQLLMQRISASDSYVYLSAINALAALANRSPSDVILSLVKSLTDEALPPELKARFAETLTKIYQDLGDLAPCYGERLVPSLLALGSSDTPCIRISGLGAMAEVSKHLRFKATKWIHEIVYCAEQATNDPDPVLRRAGVALIRGLMQGCQSDLLLAFQDELVNLYRLVKFLRAEDPDWVVRLHAELCVEVINSAVPQNVRSAFQKRDIIVPI